MDRKLQERMVGAAVLILGLVIVGPIVLDGAPEPAVDEDVPGQRSDEIRTHTFQLGQARERTQPATPAAADVPPPPMTSPAPGSATAPPAPAPEPVTAAAVSVAAAPTAAPKPAPAPKAAPAPKSPPATTAPVSGGGKWVVQVGTFGQKDNANRLVTKLGGGGFDAFVSPTTRDGKTLYRVRVGPAGTRDAAGEVAKRLAAAGQAGQVVAQ